MAFNVVVVKLDLRLQNQGRLTRLIWSYPEMVLGLFQEACFGPAD